MWCEASIPFGWFVFVFPLFTNAHITNREPMGLKIGESVKRATVPSTAGTVCVPVNRNLPSNRSNMLLNNNEKRPYIHLICAIVKRRHSTSMATHKVKSIDLRAESSDCPVTGNHNA